METGKDGGKCVVESSWTETAAVTEAGVSRDCGQWRNTSARWSGVLGACEDSAPKHTGQLHNQSNSEQWKDVWHEESLLFWIGISSQYFCGLCCCPMPCWSLKFMWMSEVSAATGGHAIESGLWYHQRPGGCSSFVLPTEGQVSIHGPETLLICVVFLTTESWVNACGLCCYWTHVNFCCP